MRQKCSKFLFKVKNYERIAYIRSTRFSLTVAPQHSCIWMWRYEMITVYLLVENWLILRPYELVIENYWCRMQIFHKLQNFGKRGRQSRAKIQLLKFRNKCKSSTLAFEHKFCSGKNPLIHVKQDFLFFLLIVNCMTVYNSMISYAYHYEYYIIILEL